MGNCVSFQVSCDEALLNRIFKCLCGEGYIRTIKKNLEALEREMENLKAHQEDVRNKVEREEAHYQKRLRVVEVWLHNVDEINKEVINVLSSRLVQLQKLCLFGLCSKNACLSYKYGKKVFKLLEQVKELKSTSDFKEVTEKISISEVIERPTRPTTGQDKMLERAWSRLMDDEVGIIGLHGMGGVGKTTLFKKIHNKFVGMSSTFDIVIWIVVSQGADISKIQKDIARKLNLYDEDWEKKDVTDKAVDINRALKRKRFVLMLDDLWEKVDPEYIGVPIPNKENKCKVVFTTRSQDVCARMGDQEPMQVKCLEPNEAWDLFKEKVGDILTRDHDIIGLAREVVSECRGLPLALCVIGEAMASKTRVQEWKHALDVLRTNAAKFSDVENQILPVLKYSYDDLKDEHIKSCFLYCALFPEDSKIEKVQLVDYWICEGFIEDYNVIERARNEGYTFLGTLICANLLLEVDSERIVMHDVVRDLALWIASDFGKQKETFVVQTRVGLQEMPKVKDQGAVRRMSLMDNNIEEITSGSNYSELTTLFLQQNRLKNLSGDFFLSMQKLAVLDLSGNRCFSELPEQMSEIASLQYLNLSDTQIEKLPSGLQYLKKLTHLDLDYTPYLCSLAGISKLLNLRILKLRHSGGYRDVSSVKELQLLKGLQVLTITAFTALNLELISGYQRLARCITYLDIFGPQQKPLDISLLASMENLCVLCLDIISVSEEIDIYIKCKESKTGSSDLHSPTISCFTNLSIVNINGCGGVKDLTWLLFAPNLVSLVITSSEEVEEIINREKATNLNLTGIIPFQKLETIFLGDLPKLESIYWNPLPFPFLKRMVVIECPKLKKLPLNGTSVPRVEEFEIKIDPECQKTDLEWEDEATKDRFLPLITKWLQVS